MTHSRSSSPGQNVSPSVRACAACGASSLDGYRQSVATDHAARDAGVDSLDAAYMSHWPEVQCREVD